MCIVANVISMNGNRRVENSESRERGDAMLYSIVMSNKQMVGNKSHAFVPLKLCVCDSTYQRTENISWKKVNQLVNNWDDHMMSEILVVPHPEENLFYVVDGWHRVLASNMMGRDSICAEILTDLSSDPETRRQEEAGIFRKQNKYVDRLKVTDLHKAGIVSHDKYDLQLKELMGMYGIKMKTKDRGSVNANELAAVAEALQTLHNENGYDIVDDVFYTVVACGWNHESGGINGLMFKSIRTMFSLHPNFETEIKRELPKILRPIGYKDAVAFATVKYPRRTNATRLGVWMEDELVERIPEMKPMYRRIPTKAGFKNGAVA